MELCVDGGRAEFVCGESGSFEVRNWEIGLVRKTDSLNFFTLLKVKI